MFYHVFSTKINPRGASIHRIKDLFPLKPPLDLKFLTCWLNSIKYRNTTSSLFSRIAECSGYLVFVLNMLNKSGAVICSKSSLVKSSWKNKIIRKKSKHDKIPKNQFFHEIIISNFHEYPSSQLLNCL